MTGRVLGIDALTAGRPATVRRERFEVPEWGGEVILRELTGAERAEILEGTIDLYAVFERNDSILPASGAEMRKTFEFMCRVVQMAWVAEDGGQVVAPEQFDLLLQQDLEIIADLAGQALVLSRLAPHSVADAKKN